MSARWFEFGDKDWVPSWYHLYLRKYLVFFYKVFGYHKLWLPALSKFIEASGRKEFLELGSGGGEVMRMLVTRLPEELTSGKRFYLSDINPLPELVEHVNAGDVHSVSYIAEPVNALEIPDSLNFPRIFTNSFHHFRPEEVGQIVKQSAKLGTPVLVLEYVRNTPLAYLSMLMGPLVTVLTMPFIAKLRDLPVMLIFTYLIPLFPLMFFWDGLVSCARAYTRKDIEEITSNLGDDICIDFYVQRNLFYPAGVTAISISPNTSAPAAGETTFRSAGEAGQGQ
jgi:SAM-dependent methyltransferase